MTHESKDIGLKKIGIILFIIGFIICFKVFDLGQYLTLSYLKTSQNRFVGFYREYPVFTLGSYMLIYILVTSLSLPGAAIMTLAGGAVFGFWAGLFAVSFASTIGATLAFLVARWLMRDWVQNRFDSHLKKVNEGIDKEGAFYLFMIRLTPLFPFWVVNLVFGLTRLPVLTYYWISQVGMLPGTMVYINAGKEIGKIETLSVILSPGLLLSFVLLGVFPLIIKKLLGHYQSRRAQKGSSPSVEE